MGFASPVTRGQIHCQYLFVPAACDPSKSHTFMWIQRASILLIKATKEKVQQRHVTVSQIFYIAEKARCTRIDIP